MLKQLNERHIVIIEDVFPKLETLLIKRLKPFMKLFFVRIVSPHYWLASPSKSFIYTWLCSAGKSSSTRTLLTEKYTIHVTTVSGWNHRFAASSWATFVEIALWTWFAFLKKTIWSFGKVYEYDYKYQVRHIGAKTLLWHQKLVAGINLLLKTRSRNYDVF